MKLIELREIEKDNFNIIFNSKDKSNLKKLSFMTEYSFFNKSLSESVRFVKRGNNSATIYIYVDPETRQKLNFQSENNIMNRPSQLINIDNEDYLLIKLNDNKK